MDSQVKAQLQEMKSKIDRIEKLAGELNEPGQGIPVVEKNAQILLCTACVLKFGIADIADIDAAQGGKQ